MQDGLGPDDPLERIKKRLYEKETTFVARKRRLLHRGSEGRPTDWSVGDIKPSLSIPSPRATFARKFFVASSVFFLLAVTVSAFFLFGGGNVISPQNVSILVSGPVSIEAGGELSLQIIIENQNDLPLESLDLSVVYPPGTREVDNLEKELSHFKTRVGVIEAHGTVSHTVRAVLFGQEADEKEIAISLEYRIKDSNAIFAGEKKHVVHIKSSPINLRVGTLKEVNTGQIFEMSIDVESNSNKILENILLTAEYPFGFQYKEAVPSPSYGTNAWRIGDLPPGAKRKIVMRGILSGQDGEEKVFRVKIGSPGSVDKRIVGIAYAETLETVEIARPFLGIQMRFNKELKSEYVMSSDENVVIDVDWVNNLPTRILDGAITVKLYGEALDRQRVVPAGGFYRSIDDTVVWDRGTVPALASIEPGEKGSVSFSLKPKSLLTLGGGIILKPSITLEVNTSGNRTGEEGVPEEIRGSLTRVIKVSSDVVFAGRALYFAGPFQNTGPIPPQAEKETTYTIVWSLVNTSNSIGGAEVQAVLPPYMRWLGSVSPSSEQVTYIAGARTVRWDLDQIESGVGITSPPREVAFGVALLPSISQIGNAPVLISRGVFSGLDSFTNTTVRAEGLELNTNLLTDPQFTKGNGLVTE